ncbi:RHS repeat domain-containing protein [Janthinobacterium aestuarii]
MNSTIAPSTTMIHTLQRTGMRLSSQQLIFTLFLSMSAIAQAATPPVVVINPPATTVTRTVSFTYDADGLLNGEIREPNNAQLRLETAYTYDAWGNRSETRVASPASGAAAIVATRSSATYDRRGQFPATQKNALGHTGTSTYHPQYGSPTSVTDANQLSVQFQYDSFGRKILEINPDGTRKKWAYALCGPYTCSGRAKYFIKMQLYASDGVTAIGPWQTNYFDELDRDILSETQGLDSTAMIYTAREYDSRGNLARSSRPYSAYQPNEQWANNQYDALNRIATTTTADGAVTRFAYNGLRSTVSNALNQTTTRVLDAKGQVAQVVDNLGQAISYQYDAFGNLWLTTDPKGNMNVMAYDSLGRKTKMYEADTGGSLYAHDALGRMVQQTDAKGQITTLGYDVLNRMTSRGETDLISSWVFDSCVKGIGKLCQVSADNGYREVVAYDGYGRVGNSSTTIDATYTASSEFDQHGRLAKQTYPTGLALKYVYTSFGFLKEVRNQANDALYWRVSEMDAEGHVLAQTYGNQIVTNAVYDNATGKVKEQYAGAGKGVQNLVYRFDQIGNLQSRSDSNQNLSETFLYDGLNRLSSATVNAGSVGLATQTYGYDGIGNITQRSGVGTYGYLETSNKPHAVSSIALTGGGKRQYTYDLNGNLINELQTTAAGAVVAAMGRKISYTSFNMPLTIATPSTSMTYVYGPSHQRTRAIAPGLTTVYLNGAGSGKLLYEKDIKANGEIEHRQFITANGVVVAVVKTAGGKNTTQYFHRDFLGSLVAVSDEAGTVIERLAYDASGKRRFPAGGQDAQGTLAGNTSKRGFTNHEHLDALGLIHMNGRVYDPLVARFMSADPGVPHPDDLQSYNRYAYARNNPLAYVDLNGFEDDRWMDLGEGSGAKNRIARFEAEKFGMNAHLFTPMFAADNSSSLVNIVSKPSAKVTARSVPANSRIPNQPEKNYGDHWAEYKREVPSMGGDGPSTNATGYDDWALGKGYMSQEQWSERAAARGAGAGIGIGVVAGGAAVAEAPAIGSWMVAGLKRLFGLGKSEVQFGNVENQVNHAFRHIDKAGMDRAAVQQAIRQDISRAAESLSKGQQYTGNVVVNGTRVEYSAFKLENGTINVGRITPPRP